MIIKSFFIPISKLLVNKYYPNKKYIYPAKSRVGAAKR